MLAAAWSQLGASTTAIDMVWVLPRIAPPTTQVAPYSPSARR